MESGFEGTVKIPWGEKVAYKFIVDGQWITKDGQPVESDPAGNWNNVYTAPPRPIPSVPDMTPQSPTTETTEVTTTTSPAAPVIDDTRAELNGARQNENDTSAVSPSYGSSLSPSTPVKNASGSPSSSLKIDTTSSRKKRRSIFAGIKRVFGHGKD
jgi:hypothetical protein